MIYNYRYCKVSCQWLLIKIKNVKALFSIGDILNENTLSVVVNLKLLKLKKKLKPNRLSFQKGVILNFISWRFKMMAFDTRLSFRVFWVVSTFRKVSF